MTLVILPLGQQSDENRGVDAADSLMLAQLLTTAALIAGTCEFIEVVKRRKTRRKADRERLAWLADQLPRLQGSGIIYCQTVADCRRVSDWLLSQGIAAPPYYSALEEHRPEREDLLLQNRVKAAVRGGCCGHPGEPGC